MEGLQLCKSKVVSKNSPGHFPDLYQVWIIKWVISNFHHNPQLSLFYM